jgi:hypothetical protein
MSKTISLNIREERMKKNCKCKKDHSSNVCRCNKKKEESSHQSHFNEIFNSGFNRR